MERRRVISLLPMRGRPWKLRNSPIAIHASQRPAEPSDIDFSNIGLKYSPKHTPEVVVKKTYWTKPPTTPPSDLPFAVERTLVGSSLPVYTDYKGGGTKVITILRRCKGDINALKDEMEKVCGEPVIIRPGKLIVDGNYHLRLKKWLAGLGF